VGGGLDYILKVLVKDVSDYQDFLKRLLKANIGLRRYFSYAVLDKIKDSEIVPDSLIRRSAVVK
jgi:Lrp/AsnC family transcriptional regulator of ectoine degradation